MTLPQNPNLNDVINELEQLQGINYKSEMASIIGFPALPDETIGQQLQSLSTLKSTLVSRLRQRQVEANVNETLLELIDKIQQLSRVRVLELNLNSSTGSVNFQRALNTLNEVRYYIEYNSLDFLPTRIIAIPLVLSESSYHTVFERNVYTVQEYVSLSPSPISSSSGNSYGYRANALDGYVTETGFRIPAIAPNQAFRVIVYG